jgi:hypothetical protein
MKQRNPYIVAGAICPECHEPPNFLHAGYCSKSKDSAPAKRKGNWMMTFTGGTFYPYDMRDEDFRVEDIAHALSMLCRYGGHCREFYSVAEHSVHVSRIVPPEDALAGLMHDATEAYLVDMPRPIKAGFPQYKDMEAKIWTHIARVFVIDEELPASVHVADGEMLWHEMAALLHPVPEGHEWGMGRARPAVLRPDMIRCWSPAKAKRKFTERFEELMEAEL